MCCTDLKVKTKKKKKSKKKFKAKQNEDSAGEIRYIRFKAVGNHSHSTRH